MAAHLREATTGVSLEEYLNDMVSGLTSKECLLLLDAATMQLHWLGTASAEAARLAGLPWSTPRAE
eukprot:2217322-Lingulodinium_polyedra.AAC.1